MEMVNEEDNGGSQSSNAASSTKRIVDMPTEILYEILFYLNVLDLSHVAQTCYRLRNVVYKGPFWNKIYPIVWCNGNFDIKPMSTVCTRLTGVDRERIIYRTMFEHFMADSNNCQEVIVKFLLPMTKFGETVTVLNVSYATKHVLSDVVFAKMVLLCPNLKVIKAIGTEFSSLAFYCVEKKGRGKKLTKIDFTLSLSLNDSSIYHMVTCLTEDKTDLAKIKGSLDYPLFKKWLLHDIPDDCDGTESEENKITGLKWLSLSGTSITDKALHYLGLSVEITDNIEFLDISGIPDLSGLAIKSFVDKCKKLEKDCVSFCDTIEYGKPDNSDVGNGCELCKSNEQTCLGFKNM